MSSTDRDADQDWLEDRLEERLRALGTNAPSCTEANCAETDPFALTGAHPNILCYEHLAERQGRLWLEEDHPAAAANDSFKTRIPGNDHRVRTEAYQAAWPQETLRNPDGSVLLKAAAAVRGWLDHMRLVIDRTVGWVPDLLERLDAWLRAELGPRWWDDFLAFGAAQ